MMEKDDPMANGMGRIRRRFMQAQKLVRRIIDLHREKPAARAKYDLRLLLKDQMDLVEIIIPRGIKLQTDFRNRIPPRVLEETGFRQSHSQLGDQCECNRRNMEFASGRVKKRREYDEGSVRQSNKSP